MLFPDALVLPHYSIGLPTSRVACLVMESCSRVMWSKSVGCRLEALC